DGVLRRLRPYAAMCALGIDKLRQHAAKILLLGSHAEQNAFGAHVAVESLDVSDREAQFDLSCWIFIGSGVQSQSGLARPELPPSQRLEFQLQSEHIAVELHSLVHISDELDHVSQLRCLHLRLPPNSMFS